MDTHDDAQLIKRNRKFPGLRILLNPQLFVNVLRRVAPETQWGEAKAQYASYEQNVGCLVSYNVKIPGSSLQIYAKAYEGSGSRQKLDNVRKNAECLRVMGQKSYVIEEPAISIHHFPDDNKLATLRKLSQPETRIGLLDDLLAENKHFRQGAIHGLRYRPEQRFVAKVPVKDNAYAVLKVYSEENFLPALNGAEAFNSTEILGIPKRLGSCPRRLTQIFEWMQGVPLSNFLCSPMINFAPLRKAGKALAALHAQEVWGLEHSSGEREIKTLKEDALGLAALCPELLPQLKLMTTHLGRRLMNEQEFVRPCHGNFYASKALINNESEKVNILGFDKPVFGDPAMDLGLFFAHLERDVLYHRLSAKDAETCKNIFLEGYSAIMHPPSTSRLETYQAGGLIKLAVEPFRNRESSWFNKMKKMLIRAGEICAEENFVDDGNQKVSDKSFARDAGQGPAILEDKLVWSSHTPEIFQDNLQILCAQAC